MDTAELDYDLPASAIAQQPVEPRDAARLLVDRGPDAPPTHRTVADLPDLLRPGDLLVVNDTRVIPARLHLRKPTGGAVEVLLLERRPEGWWEGLVRPSRRVAVGTRLVPATDVAGAGPVEVVVGEVLGDDGRRRIELHGSDVHGSDVHGSDVRGSDVHGLDVRGSDVRGSDVRGSDVPRSDVHGPYIRGLDAQGSGVDGAEVARGLGADGAGVDGAGVDGPGDDGSGRVGDDDLGVLVRHGEVPLPPYIHEPLADPERYQTVYADRPGSVAAPTAGLHLTDAVLGDLRAKGIEVATVDLVVGLGTFRPITAARVEDHPMHAERYRIPDETAQQVTDALADPGRRVVAVGTTVVRALEAWAATGEAQGATRLFIHGDRPFAVVDVLMTNFHVPRSSLLALVQAFVGPRWRDLYEAALAEGYRFLSFGDAMLLTRRAERTGQEEPT